ncbi:MAG: nucleoside hydrolase, partial [Thermoguttaceae bacterium]|nr:nucleoside hydrolase [Thermoguttaceae bacterium]
MSKILLSAFYIAALFVSASFLTQSIPTSAAEPTRIILDTDLGNDVDDVFAMAMLNNLNKRREVDFLAAVISKDNPFSAPYARLIQTFYGAEPLPIGRIVGSGTEPEDGPYAGRSLEATDETGALMFPFFDYKNDKSEYPEATQLLRRTLAESPNASVVIVVTGYLTNLSRLLKSPADEISPLSGRELAARKVSRIVLVAAQFDEKYLPHKEYNISVDIPAAQHVFNEWPTPIFVSPFELGFSIFISPESL